MLGFSILNSKKADVQSLLSVLLKLHQIIVVSQTVAAKSSPPANLIGCQFWRKFNDMKVVYTYGSHSLHLFQSSSQSQLANSLSMTLTANSHVRFHVMSQFHRVRLGLPTSLHGGLDGFDNKMFQNNRWCDHPRISAYILNHLKKTRVPHFVALNEKPSDSLRLIGEDLLSW